MNKLLLTLTHLKYASYDLKQTITNIAELDSKVIKAKAQERLLVSLPLLWPRFLLSLYRPKHADPV